MKVRLGDVFEIGSGGTPSKTHPEYYGGDIPWVKTGDLKSEYLYEVEDFITEEGLKNSSAKIYEPDTVLIAMYGATIGATSILKMEACTNQACAAFKKSDSVIPEYLYYFLKSQKNRFVKDGVGGAQPNISAGYLKKIEMELPSLKEQRIIVDILDKIYDVIVKRTQEMSALDELIKARFVELFGYVHEDRFPKCKLRDVAHIKHGYAFSGEFFSEEDNGVVLVTPGNFALGGGFQEVRNKYFTSDYPDEYVLHTGDLIVTMTDLSKKTDTLGYGAIVPDTGKIYLHNQRIGLFDKLDERFNPIFVRWYMQTDEYRLEIVRTSTGSTVHHTSPDRILDSVIFVPPMELQKQFAEFVKQVDKSKVAVQKSLDETQLLFDSLMQKYFA